MYIQMSVRKAEEGALRGGSVGSYTQTIDIIDTRQIHIRLGGCAGHDPPGQPLPDIISIHLFILGVKLC